MSQLLLRLVACAAVLLSVEAASATILCADNKSNLVRLRQSECRSKESHVDSSELLLPDTTPSRWAWLADTYWYVPPQNLRAYLWQTEMPEGETLLSDQTVWHIDRYESGYIFGTTVTNFDRVSTTCSYLKGSVTPPGMVYIAFTPVLSDQSLPTPTVAVGKMARKRAGWTFAMQMATPGPPIQVPTQVEHWAFMEQCTPEDDCWTKLPGIDGGFDDLFSQCDFSPAE